MKVTGFLVTVTLFIVLVMHCAGNKKLGTNPLFDEITDKQDFVIYTGSLPCPGCNPGVILKLYRDSSYIKEVIPESSGDEVMTLKGSYSWSKKVITLQQADSVYGHSSFRIDSNRLLPVQDTGDFFTRNENPLFETYWRLVEVNGTIIQRVDVSAREAHLILKILNGRVFGSSGCNRFSGRYQLSGNRLKISQVISTKMACNNVPYEGDFYSALQGSTAFRISDDTLLLLRQDEVAARFIAGKSQLETNHSHE